MTPILAGAVMKGLGLTIGATVGYAIYKSGILRPVGLEVLKAGYKAKAWVASAGKEAPKEKAEQRKAARITPRTPSATQQIINIVRDSKKAVRVKTLVEKTGFADETVRAILTKALKRGQIRRVGRGLYVGA
jgi:hypothetical protein